VKEQQLAFPIKENLQELGLNEDLMHIFAQSGILLNLAEQQLDKKSLEIVWPGIVMDSALYAVVFSFLKESTKNERITDEIFSQYDARSCEQFLKDSPLFQSLSSDKIILTKAHRLDGIDSKNHVLTVFKNVLTNTLSGRERFIMRVFALMHDNSKMLVAGYDGIVEDLMKKIGNVDDITGEVKHSCVDHELLSSLIFRSILNHNKSMEKIFDQENIDDQEDVDYIATLIAHHHFFPKLEKHLGENTFDEDSYFKEIPELAKNKRWKYLLHSFLFSLADISATRGHWQHLFPSIELFERLTEIYSKEKDVDSNLLIKMEKSIEEAKTKYAFCKEA